MTEEWRHVLWGRGNYEVSNLGRVRNGRRILKAPPNAYGYPSVGLRAGPGQAWTVAVHRLVMLTFRGPPPNGAEVAHNNGIRNDNRLENLRYATRQENMKDRDRHGTTARGERMGNAKLTAKDVAEFKRLYKPLCPTYGAKAFAARLGVSYSAINGIIIGKSWPYIPWPNGRPSRVLGSWR